MLITYSGSSLVLSSSGISPVDVYLPIPVPSESYDQIYVYYKCRVEGDFQTLTGSNIPTIWNPAFLFAMSYESASILRSVDIASGSASNPKSFGIMQLEYGNQVPNSFSYSNLSQSVTFGTNFTNFHHLYIPSSTSSKVIDTQNITSIPVSAFESNKTFMWKICKGYGSNSILYNFASTSRSFSDIRDLKWSIEKGSSEWVSYIDFISSGSDLQQTILSGSNGFLSPSFFVIRYTDPIANRKFIIDQLCVEWVDSSRTILP